MMVIIRLITRLKQSEISLRLNTSFENVLLRDIKTKALVTLKVARAFFINNINLINYPI